MQVTTDYTGKENRSTLEFGGMQAYRVVHWLKDVLKDFLLSSRNLLDERLGISADRKDDLDAERIDSLFRVDTTFNPNARAAGATPLILVSPTSSTYPAEVLTEIGGRDESVNNGFVRYIGTRIRTIDVGVSVITSSCDGTVLLAGLVEDFLVTSEPDLLKDCGCLSMFKVMGSQGPVAVDGGREGSTGPLYKTDISVRMTGYLKWLSDTPGPLYRGIGNVVQKVL